MIIKFIDCENIVLTDLTKESLNNLVFAYENIWEDIAKYLSQKFDNPYLDPRNIKYDSGIEYLDILKTFSTALVNTYPPIRLDDFKEGILIKLNKISDDLYIEVK